MDRQVADVGTKSLPEGQFVLHRDVMNGRALVKAAHPKKTMPPLAREGDATHVTAALSVMHTVAMEVDGCLSVDQLQTSWRRACVERRGSGNKLLTHGCG
jgi:hypothetical protein